MNDIEKNLINKLMFDEISKEIFIKEFPVDIIKNSDYLINLLKKAEEEKDADDIEDLLFIVFKFNIVNNEYINVLNRLLEEEWHNKHEDIVTLLQKIKSNDSVNALYKTATKNFEYLSYDSSNSLAIKCIWALAKINTPDSLEKLKLLSKSENSNIRNASIEQINKLSSK